MTRSHGFFVLLISFVFALLGCTHTLNMDIRPYYRPIFLSTAGLVVFVTVVLAHSVLLPFVLAIVLAYVMTPLVIWFEKRGLSEVASILLVYCFLFGGTFFFIRLLVPRITFEMTELIKELPSHLDEFREKWFPKMNAFVEKFDQDGFDFKVLTQKLTDLLKVHGGDLAISLQGIVGGVVTAIFRTGITLMLAAYLVLTRQKIFTFFETLLRPNSRPAFRALVSRVDRGLAGVVRGQLVICAVNGLLSAIGFGSCGLKYWPVMAVVAMIGSLVPIFGSILSSVPAVALGLTQSFGTGLFVLAWIVGIHQLEANFLNPKIMGDAAKIHPVLVVFSLLVGEHWFGAIGALLAVPCMSLAQSFFIHFDQIGKNYDNNFAEEKSP